MPPASVRTVGILIFENVEVLDFCGPLEVFSVTKHDATTRPFEVFTVAETLDPVLTRNHLSVNPTYAIANCPPLDVLLIPGGQGTRQQIHNPTLLNWIEQRSQSVEKLLSVCTGALLLAKLGLLEDLAATTHHSEIDLLRQMAPNTKICPEQRIVDNGKIILSAGISAGIDMSFYVVSQLLGQETAIATAKYMEYDWPPS